MTLTSVVARQPRKGRLIFSKHVKVWKEQKCGRGFWRGMKLRLTVLARAISNLADLTCLETVVRKVGVRCEILTGQ
jgi:hypothetical protein